LALQPSPSLTLLDILEKSALTGAYGFYLVAAAGTIFRCDFHALSANRLISFCFSRLLARAFDQRPLATHCNLSTSKRTGTAFALAASRIPLREADRTRPTLGFLPFSPPTLRSFTCITFSAVFLRNSNSYSVLLVVVSVSSAPTYVPLQAVRQHYATLKTGTRSHVTHHINPNCGYSSSAFKHQFAWSLPLGGSA
jgi:hypothetical protein